MNKSSGLLLLTIALGSLTTGCSSDESMNRANAEKVAAIQAEKARHKAMSGGDMAEHEGGQMQHSMPMSEHSGGEIQHAMPMPDESTGAVQSDASEIGRRADDLPAPLNRTQSQLVSVDLYTDELVAEMMPGVTYQYWTYNGKVPGPFIRARAGDQVEIHLNHGKPGAAGTAHSEHTSTEHANAGHSAHSIDLHAVVGPGGGAPLMQVGQGEQKSFRFKATHPGIYVYHCASLHVPTHIANGMYGMILVEPEQGLAKVDREFYVMQGDFYTGGKYGDKGLQAFSKDKMLAEKPEYFLFNGRVNSLSGERALKAKVGEKIRLFVGVGSHVASNFHIIGAIFDNLYPDGAIMNPPLKNVQTTVIAPGSAVMIEFTAEVPGKYLLVDHSLTRAIDKGALAELIIEGAERPELYQQVAH
ncbi:dissimilatory nitrite reductase (NO-forming) copper type apoprotein [Methylobacter tundripaludum]|uniref:Copper-containing nitrite reductase n=1 Tax=Methylobacter tundripaludum TaxID=173365 RepID=A0A2S6H4W0_9GAMM|nr:copper-containing nitrite reductase [Methylobacter tundripaludum]PPK72471.1 dissimilatory nitrite reductase (NO-forming) copper type apoprotein [Methylobacter tundripaludum]